MHVAFVLLAEAALPDPDLIAASYAGLFPARGPLVPAGDESGDAERQAVALAGADGLAQVVLESAPVADGEAERAAAHSLAAIGSEDPFPSHAAHLAVAWFPAEGVALLDALRAQARALAAVALASDAVGVYVPTSSATHPGGWYVDVAREVEDPTMLWIGVSHALTDDDRHSFLSYGMNQFSLPDLLLTTPLSEGGEGLEYFYKLLGASSAAGAPIAPGEIVGRTPGELLTARQEQSPVDDDAVVTAIDLPEGARE